MQLFHTSVCSFQHELRTTYTSSGRKRTVFHNHFICLTASPAIPRDRITPTDQLIFYHVEIPELICNGKATVTAMRTVSPLIPPNISYPKFPPHSASLPFSVEDAFSEAQCESNLSGFITTIKQAAQLLPGAVSYLQLHSVNG